MVEREVHFNAINKRYCMTCGGKRATHLIIEEGIFNVSDIHHYRRFLCRECFEAEKKEI